MKKLNIILLLVSCYCIILSGALQDVRVYYDSNWNPLPMLSQGETPSGEELPANPNNLKFGPLPCSCENFTCGCCANLNFTTLQRSGCLNFTYDPNQFAVEMNMLMNDESVYTNSISAKNPPPACMDAPIPYLPNIAFCIRLYDVYTPGSNLHVCINFETRVVQAPVLVLQFDCLQMGSDGFSYLKPNVTLSYGNEEVNIQKVDDSLYTQPEISP